MVAAARTSVVPRGGKFRDLDYDEIAIPPLLACIEQSGLSSSQVDELIVSNALGAGGNPARVIALAGNLPNTLGGITIDRQCAGGLDSILLGQALIASGQADVVIAGGSESYSLRPQRKYKSKWDEKAVLREQARFTPWKHNDPDMAESAHKLAQLHKISKDEQDQWAIHSHSKALASSNQLQNEIFNPDNALGDLDPFTRNLDINLCNRAKQISGSITTANSSVAADGAALVTLVSKSVHNKLKPKFSLKLQCGKTLGGDPALPGLAPVKAIAHVIGQSGIAVSDIKTVEIMEAYAVQAMVCIRETGINPEVVNLGGGSLARGHPVGASGAILAVRLFHQLSERKTEKDFGLTAIASAGGLGTAVLFESALG